MPSIARGCCRLQDLRERDASVLVVRLGVQEVLRCQGMGAIHTAGGERVLPIRSIGGRCGRLRATASADGLTCIWKAGRDPVSRMFELVRVSLTNATGQVWAGRLSVRMQVEDAGPPRWMIPGCFYRENRPASFRARFPRYDASGAQTDEMASAYWGFRSSRSTLPSVFCWTSRFSAALLVEERFSHGETGLFFRGDASGTWIGLDFPYSEEPCSYASWRGFAPDRPLMTLRPGEAARAEFRIFVGPHDLHAYDGPIRERYRRLRPEHPVHPWVGVEEAARLAAHGLLTWHYLEDFGIIRDTVGFDPITSGIAGGRDSFPLMSIAWAGGLPCAQALLEYGRRCGDERCVRAALAVVERVLGARSPCGVLHTMWHRDRGWLSGLEDANAHRSHVRIVAEAILFLLRAYRFEREHGFERPAWGDLVRENLDFAIVRQREDGNFGYAYDTRSGAVTEWDGCGGLVWVAALAEAARAFGEERYRQAAERGGASYACFVEDQYLYGAPSDVYLTPTSEDGYNAVIAYVDLYELTDDARWLALARLAADWMLTFRFAYNVSFPGDTILGAYDYRTRGGDVASPCNAHVHTYGLVCLPELLRLAGHARDAYYRQRAADNLCCALQFIARADGDFNAGKGMVSEQWYHTDWWRPKGSLLALSHSWCIGMVLRAAVHVLASDAGLLEAAS